MENEVKETKQSLSKKDKSFIGVLFEAPYHVSCDDVDFIGDKNKIFVFNEFNKVYEMTQRQYDFCCQVSSVFKQYTKIVK